MCEEILADLENVFKTISRISVSDTGVDLMFSAKEQLKSIYAKLNTMNAAEKEVV